MLVDSAAFQWKKERKTVQFKRGIWLLIFTGGLLVTLPRDTGDL
jgi:hypothetical protein